LVWIAGSMVYDSYMPARYQYLPSEVAPRDILSTVKRTSLVHYHTPCRTEHPVSKGVTVINWKLQSVSFSVVEVKREEETTDGPQHDRSPATRRHEAVSKYRQESSARVVAGMLTALYDLNSPTRKLPYQSLGLPQQSLKLP